MNVLNRAPRPTPHAARSTQHSLLITRHSLRDLLAFAILALVTFAFFWPVFLAGQWIPHGGGDLVSFVWPQYSFAAQSIRSGSIPLWNPHLYSGAPFLADNQSGVLYPINLVAFGLFPNFTYPVMEGLVIFHIWLAGAAMYVALRLWPTNRPINPLPALLGAIAYMLNDVMITHIGNLNLIAAAAWLPLVFGLFARGLHDRKTGLAIGAGAVYAIAILAGHAQVTAITLIGLVVIATWQLILQLKSRADKGSRHHGDLGDQPPISIRRLLWLSTLALVVAFGVAAIQLLPSLEMTGYSLRSGLSYDEATAYSLPPAALASFFSPLLFGRGAVEFWGSWQRVETGYLGVVPLLLMGLAFTRKRSNGVWCLAALGLLGLSIAPGKYTPIYSIIHSLPVLGSLRVPARFILLTDFAIAGLAALGLQQLSDRQIPARGILMWCITVASFGSIALVAAYASVPNAGHANDLTSALTTFVAFIALASLGLWWVVQSPISNLQAPIIFVILAALELIALGSTIEVDANDPTLGFSHQAVVDFLRRDQNVYRIENTSSAWQPDAALMSDLSDIGGIFNPLGLANYETYRGGMGQRGSPLYNLLGVKYVLSNKNDPPGDASFVPVFNADPQIDVYLNTHALPRAMLIDRAVIVRSGEAAWQAIHAPDFDPAQTVIVEGGIGLSGGDEMDRRSLSFMSQTNDRVELLAQTSSPVYLVLTDVYYPGWTATIDDRPTELYPANFAFRAVRVPAGSHRVRFQFEPTAWRWGILISGATLLGLVGATGLAWRKKLRSVDSDARISTSNLAVISNPLQEAIMSSASDRTAPERRLRFLRYGLIIVTAVAFAIAAATSLFSKAGDLGGALLQGVLWGVIAGVVSVVVYLIYKNAVLKA